MPKVPPTPYFIFMKSKMEKLKRKHPKLPVTEAAQKIGVCVCVCVCVCDARLFDR